MRRLVVAAVAAVLLAACGKKADYIDWQRMKEQAKAVPYRETPFLPYGRELQPPPEGTVARSRVLGKPILTEGMEGSAYAARIPVPVTAELVERGRDRFNVVCAACHGVAGDGDSEVARQMTLRRPPSLLSPLIRGYPPGRIFRVATMGYGLMPSYRTQLTAEDRWAIVAYVRALQIAQGSRVADLPAGARREASERADSAGGAR